MVQERQVAIVTGASSGFGRLSALTLARKGYRVFAAFRGSHGGFDVIAGDLRETAVADGGELEAIRIDVADDVAVRDGMDRILAATDGRVDVLVNAAGFGTFGPFEAIEIERWRAQYETNVFGTVRMAQAVLPAMRRAGRGIVINFGSDIGLRANFWQSAYASSKFAVVGLTEAMRLELQQFGIRVCLVSPGWYDTPFGQSGVSLWDRDVAALYRPLQARWEAGVNAVEGANPAERAQEVADLVAAIAEQDHPAFLNPSGWNPDRPHNVVVDEFDRYEDRLFGYYGIGDFRSVGTRR